MARMAFEGYLEADGRNPEEGYVIIRVPDQTRLPYSTRIGKVKSIGVSNFSETKLAEILPTAKVIPAVNQVRHGSASAQLPPMNSPFPE